MVLLFYFVGPTKSQKRAVVMETPAQPQQFQTSASKLRFKAQPQETCEIVQILNFQTSTIENLNFDQSWEPSI